MALSELDYPLNVLAKSVKEYLKEIFDINSKLQAIALCRNRILNPNAGVKLFSSYFWQFYFVDRRHS